jgi:predicted outer membrane lipoprotein
MKRTTQERPFEQQACLAFVGLSVVTATLGFWAKGWLPGVLLTIAMCVVVFLLSRAVERVQEAWSTRNWFTAWVAGLLALGFGVIEANLNHIGLDHLNTAYALAPAAYIWPACFFISGVNVFASFGFARVLEDKSETKAKPREKSADVLVFGPNLQERQTLREIGEKLRASGAM